MTQTVFILNGPNLNLLGEREPHIYGYDTLATIEQRCIARGQELGFAIDFRQSNLEGEIINSVHEARKKAVAIIINPAAYSFTSIAILDALKAFDGVKLEVHLSNIHRREALYHHSLVSKTADAVIAGLGADGYILALDALRRRLDAAK